MEEGTRHSSKSLPLSDPISDLLASYQEVVKSLIGQTFHAGLSASELEYFRAHLGTSAFTCRLTACSRATIGFLTENMLREHERSHINWLRCTAPGCQYPPRFSPRTLKVHMNKHHPSPNNPKPIRKSVSKKVYPPISGFDADVDPDFDTFLGQVGSHPELDGNVPPPQLIHPNQSLSPSQSPAISPRMVPQQMPDLNQLSQNSFGLAGPRHPYGDGNHPLFSPPAPPAIDAPPPLPITPPLGYMNQSLFSPPPPPDIDVPPPIPPPRHLGLLMDRAYVYQPSAASAVPDLPATLR